MVGTELGSIVGSSEGALEGMRVDTMIVIGMVSTSTVHPVLDSRLSSYVAVLKVASTASAQT